MRTHYPDRSMAGLIDLIGSDKFADQFFSTMDGVVSMDHCTVFVSENDAISPLVSQAHGPIRDKVQMLARSYVAHGHQMDPIWSRIIKNHADDPVVINPSAMQDDAYRREFYDSVNIFEEVSFFGEQSGRKIYIGFYRERPKGHFRPEEVELLSACGQSLVSLLSKQADMARRLAPVAPAQALSREELWKKVNVAILEDAPQLTPREAEICSGIILGYTVVGLSLNLGISINTVATHRKRAYAKLKISSQNELFMHYFGLVERLNS